MLALLVLASLSILGGEVMPPSQYVGLVDVFNGIPNGQIPSKTKNYTGKWEYQKNSSYEYICGHYNNGIPSGQWSISFQFGGYFVVNYYYGQGYTSTSYYPDGLPKTQSFGDVELTKNSFFHKTKDVDIWDPMGNKMPKKRFNPGKGWNWGEQARTVYDKERQFDDAEIHIKINVFIVNDNSLMVAFYLYSDQCFIQKKVFEYSLNHDSGTIQLTQKYTFGFNEDSKLIVKSSTQELSSTNKEIMITVGYELKNKHNQIDIPITIELK